MPELISVKATEKRYRALRHVPSNEGFDERGFGLWPDDSFTHRLVAEGAIKLASPPEADADDEEAPKRKAAPKKDAPTADSSDLPPASPEATLKGA